MNIRNLKSVCFLLLCAGIFSVACEKKKIEPITSSADPLKETSIPASCTNCHNAAFPEHLTNGHKKHTEGLYSFACSTCHFGHGDGNPTHQNGVKNITFNPNGMAMRNGNDTVTPIWNLGSKTCDNVYCHSNGRSADRGEDGTFNWVEGGSTSPGPQPATYLTTPNWETGKITTCICHNGLGNMTSPYTVTQPNTMDTSYFPASGQHRRGAHVDNDQGFHLAPYASPIWGSVQCFWCHNTNAIPSNPDDTIALVDAPNKQGTYSTPWHVDGETYFKPTNVNYAGPGGDSLSFYGGTIAIGMNRSYNGTSGHCGNSSKCW